MEPRFVRPSQPPRNTDLLPLRIMLIAPHQQHPRLLLRTSAPKHHATSLLHTLHLAPAQLLAHLTTLRPARYPAHSLAARPAGRPRQLLQRADRGERRTGLGPGFAARSAREGTLVCGRALQSV